MDAIQLREKVLDRLPKLKTEQVCPVPNSRFWDFYRDNKDALVDACIGVRKDDAGEWVVVAHPYEDAEAREARELAEIKDMRARHEYLCNTCGQFTSPFRTRIKKKEMRNGFMKYNFVCCGWTLGSGLPHKLVEYLVSVEKFTINDDWTPPARRSRC